MCCCSFVTQVIYGIICFCTIALTLGSMFTPGWTDVTSNVNVSSIKQGIWPFTCTESDLGSINGKPYCDHWFENLPNSMKIVVACMCLAALLEVVAFVYNILTTCTCCFKKYLLPLLTVLSVLIVIPLAAAVAVYGVNHKNYITGIKNWQSISHSSLLGYSFYMACGALVLAVINAMVASTSSFFAERSC